MVMITEKRKGGRHSIETDMPSTKKTRRSDETLIKAMNIKSARLSLENCVVNKRTASKEENQGRFTQMTPSL